MQPLQSLCCYDRVVITGTLPTVCYAAGMTKFLNATHVRIFDYPRFAEPLRELVRERAAALAVEAGITIEHIGKKHVRKEAVVAKVLEHRGEHPGLVHMISAMEGCDTYKPWHDKQTDKTYLRPDNGQCLHYYFYFMDAELGLIHLRVPTWAPFRLQFYCNGHSRLARQLAAEGIGFTAADNAFTERAPTGVWPKWQERWDRLIEAMDIIRALWGGEVVSHKGQFYTVDGRRHVLAVLRQIPSSSAVSSTPRPLAASRMILARSASFCGVECVRPGHSVRAHAQPTVRLLTLCVPAYGRPHVVRRPVGINPRFRTRARNIATQISAGLWQIQLGPPSRTETSIPARCTRLVAKVEGMISD